MKKTKGWRNESMKHGLAARGISSSPIYFSSNGKSIQSVKENLINYLKQMVEMKKTMQVKLKDYDYNGMEEYILKNGQFFTPSNKLPEGIDRMEIKQCYHNSFMCLASNPDLKLHYVEGYAISKKLKDFPMPFEHAWLVDDKGRVYDPTWDDGIVYYGVAFKRDYVIKTVLKKGYTGIIDDWQSKYQIFKQDNPKIRQAIRGE
jgi:hypothetical protein